MCGICGIVDSGSRRAVDRERLERINEALRHRGPDDGGVWCDGFRGLAARRLKILDLDKGHQPMFNGDQSLAAVFNGEIYNFQELRQELEAKGVSFHTRCDTEVVLKAYEAYGDEAVTRFNGMFAFAVYDTRRERLFIARDRLGIKPLYYRCEGGVCAFASELDALLQSGLVTGPLDPAALDAYFSFLCIPAPDTVFSDVRKLRPGETLVFENGEAKLQAYWRPEFKPDTTWTLESAAEAYVDLLRDAIELRRISDVPLGAFLSGGVDSSSVVALLSEVGGGDVKTFSIGFDDPEANELPYARLMAERVGADHTEQIMAPDLTEMAGGLARHFGEPFADSSAIPTWLVSKLARDQVTVALSGDGGDESFAGYSWLHLNRHVATYRKVPRSLRALLHTVLALAPQSPRMARLQRFSGDSFLGPHESFRRRHTCFAPEQRAALYRDALRRGVEAAATDRFQEHADSVSGLSDDDWMLHQDLRMYLPDDVLTKVDRMSMAAGLEARLPLLDHRLVEFAATVPFSLKLEGRTSKRLVKHAVRNLLPPELLEQRKRGFAIPIQRWFREDLGRLFTETVLTPESLSAKFLRPETAQQLFPIHQARKENHGHHLWTLLQFELWLRYVSGIPGMGGAVRLG